jgi:mono/diheme cytochrome c family protein
MRRLALAFIGIAVALSGQAAEPQGEAAATGQQLFASRCGMCHRAGGMGTGLLSRRPDGGAGLLEERRDLLGPFVQAVVRAGTGNMPRIARGEVSDAELARIAAYLAKEQIR